MRAYTTYDKCLVGLQWLAVMRTGVTDSGEWNGKWMDHPVGSRELTELE
jgi:hypothetical protein